MSRARGGMTAARRKMADAEDTREEEAREALPGGLPVTVNPPTETLAGQRPGERRQPPHPRYIPDQPVTPRDAQEISSLTAEEAAEYAACGRVIDHYHQATWMYGKALQAVRDARYYPEVFSTWPEFLSSRCGLSYSQAHRTVGTGNR